MILPALREQETCGEQKGEYFRHRDSQPDAVHVKDKRQDQYSRGLKDQRAHEGDRSRYRAVI